MESLCLAAMCFLAALFPSSEGASWAYTGSKGVDQWAAIEPKCGGSQQSPIDLADPLIAYDSTLQPFAFTNFDSAAGVNWTLTNNGHTAGVAVAGPKMEVSGGSLGDVYRVAQFHFHWGSDNTRGSEHTLNGLAFPMEIHVVCFNTRYNDIATAVRNSNGLAVLGFFFEIAPNANPQLDDIITGLASIKNPTESARVPASALSDIMQDTKQFFRYRGSLTTPTCNEVVTWTVFNSRIAISSAQMEAFRGILDNDGVAMVNNYRPVMALNGRAITASFKDENFASSASGLGAASLAVAAGLLAALAWRL